MWSSKSTTWRWFNRRHALINDPTLRCLLAGHGKVAGTEVCTAWVMGKSRTWSSMWSRPILKKSPGLGSRTTSDSLVCPLPVKCAPTPPPPSFRLVVQRRHLVVFCYMYDCVLIFYKLVRLRPCFLHIIIFFFCNSSVIWSVCFSEYFFFLHFWSTTERIELVRPNSNINKADL